MDGGWVLTSAVRVTSALKGREVCEPPTRKRALSPFQGDTKLHYLPTHYPLSFSVPFIRSIWYNNIYVNLASWLALDR
jgi:hypothetical protein